MLGIDFKSLDIGGTFVTTPQLHCGLCNKLSGFDDFIHEALADGIHSKEFVLGILNRVGSENVRPSPPHRLKCMNCNFYYKHPPPASGSSLDSIEGEAAVMGWASGFGWTHDIKERDDDLKKQNEELYNTLKANGKGETAPSEIERDSKNVP